MAQINGEAEVPPPTIGPEVARLRDSVHIHPTEQRTRPKFSVRTLFIVSGVIFAITIPAMIGIAVDKDVSTNELPLVFLGFIVGSVIYGAVFYSMYFGIRSAISSMTSKSVEKAEDISRSSEQLQTALEADFVTNLVRINFKYIDAYYLQTRIQADKSFTFTLFAAVISLLLIVLGIGFSFFGKTDPAVVSAGAGTLGEFISAVFFYLYIQTVAKMAEYHRKLVFTQNIGLALKISDGLPAEQKTKAQAALIETLSKDINQYLGS